MIDYNKLISTNKSIYRLFFKKRFWTKMLTSDVATGGTGGRSAPLAPSWHWRNVHFIEWCSMWEAFFFSIQNQTLKFLHPPWNVSIPPPRLKNFLATPLMLTILTWRKSFVLSTLKEKKGVCCRLIKLITNGRFFWYNNYFLLLC